MIPRAERRESRGSRQEVPRPSANRRPPRPSASVRAASWASRASRKTRLSGWNPAAFSMARATFRNSGQREATPTSSSGGCRQISGERSGHGPDLQREQLRSGGKQLVAPLRRDWAAPPECAFWRDLGKSCEPARTGPGTSPRERSPPPEFAAVLRPARSAENDPGAAIPATAAGALAARATTLPACVPSGKRAII